MRHSSRLLVVAVMCLTFVAPGATRVCARAWSRMLMDPKLGVVVVGTGSDRLCAVDAVTGAVRWSRSMEAVSSGWLALDGDRVIVVRCLGVEVAALPDSHRDTTLEVDSIDASNGRVIWRYARPGHLTGHPLLVGKRLLLGCASKGDAGALPNARPGSFLALDVQTGACTFAVPGVVHEFTVDGPRVDVVFSNHTGSPVTASGSGPDSPPAAEPAKGQTAKCDVASLNLESGRVCWRLNGLQGTCSVSPTIVRGTVLVETRSPSTRAAPGTVSGTASAAPDLHVYGLRVTDGHLDWSTSFAGRTSLVSLDPAGMWVRDLGTGAVSWYDVSRGVVRWSLQPPVLGRSAGFFLGTTVVDGQMYLAAAVPHGAATVRVLNTQDGSMCRAIVLPGKCEAGPDVVGGLVLVGVRMSTARARRLGIAAPLEAVAGPSPTTGATHLHVLLACSARTLRYRWGLASDGLLAAPPVVSDATGDLLLRTARRCIGVSPADGRVLWSVAADVACGPAVTARSLVFGDDHENLVIAFLNAGRASRIVISTKPWFDFRRLPNLAFVCLIVVIILVLISQARRGRPMFIRRLAGLNAVDEAVGRATEMGKPVLYICGTQDVDEIQTLAGLSILSHVARRAAEYETSLLVPTSRSVVLTMAQEVVKEAHYHVGRPDSYQSDNVRYLSDDQFGFVAGVDGIMLREKPAANFFMGCFYGESLILAETGHATGAIQIAGTAEPSQLPFFVAACDYTLMGEELYAASAYLSRDPQEVGSLKGQDYAKLLILAVIIVGCLVYPWFPQVKTWLSP